MDRRVVLKIMAGIPLINIAGCKKLLTPRVSKWIAFKDQTPEPTDKFEMREMNKPHQLIRKGEILKFKEATLENEEGEIRKLFNTDKCFVMYRLTDNCMLCINNDKWEWRYVS